MNRQSKLSKRLANTIFVLSINTENGGLVGAKTFIWHFLIETLIIDVGYLGNQMANKVMIFI